MAQRVQESIEVQAPLHDVYNYWSNFENFPRFMDNIEEVRMTGEDTSHWKVKGPAGVSVEFDARTTEMAPERSIGWNSLDGQVMTSGEVSFEEIQPDRTRVELTMNYADPPGGKAGEAAASILSDPEKRTREDLQNFARIVERGELGGSQSQTPQPVAYGDPRSRRDSSRRSGRSKGGVSLERQVQHPPSPTGTQLRSGLAVDAQT